MQANNYEFYECNLCNISPFTLKNLLHICTQCFNKSHTRAQKKAKPPSASKFFAYTLPYYRASIWCSPCIPSIFLMPYHLICMHLFVNCWAFLITGIYLRNLPPAHSGRAVTFSGPCPPLNLGISTQDHW